MSFPSNLNSELRDFINIGRQSLFTPRPPIQLPLYPLRRTFNLPYRNPGFQEDSVIDHSSLQLLFERENVNNQNIESPKDTIKSEQYIEYNTLRDQNLECSICLSIIDGTVAITDCLHRFCSSCIFNYLSSKRENASCPNCRAELDIDKLTISSELTNIIDETIIKCKNNECIHQLKKRDYRSHISICEYNKEQCQDCKSLFYKKDLQSHREHCSHRLIKCEKCSIHFNCNLVHECQTEIVKCPNNKCHIEMERSKINRHVSLCLFRIISCRHCDSQCEYIDKNIHEKICINRPINCDLCEITIPYSDIQRHYNICPNNSSECKWCSNKIINSMMMNHELVCLKKKIKCIQGCGDEIIKEDFRKHNEVCNNRYISCDKCSQYYIYSKKLDHMEMCPEELVMCVHCSSWLMRKNMDLHIDRTCELRQIKCKYEYAKCNCIFTRRSEVEHYREYKDYHLNILENFIHENLEITECNDNNDVMIDVDTEYDSDDEDCDE